MAGHPSGSGSNPDSPGETGADLSIRVTVPLSMADEAGAIFMDDLGPFEQEITAPGPVGIPPCPEPHGRPTGGAVDAPSHGEALATLVFYPPTGAPSTREDLLQLLPDVFAGPGMLQVETREVSRDWVEGWRDHFRPVTVGAVRIRPPWEPPLCESPAAKAVEVVINPGLGFGTGLHPTTRGALLLLQEGLAHAGTREVTGSDRGPLVDVGTGSGILAIAAAKLGWAPVTALDNDPVALLSARENVAANGVESEIEVLEAEVAGAEVGRFRGATALANMTLEPVTVLLQRLAGEAARPRRLLVSGILAGSQEEQLMLTAHEAGFGVGRRMYEGEWVSLELFPVPPEEPGTGE